MIQRATKKPSAKQRAERMKILLKNASRCFRQCYSPFCHSELSRMNVSANECKDLSALIADIIDDHLEIES